MHSFRWHIVLICSITENIHMSLDYGNICWGFFSVWSYYLFHFVSSNYFDLHTLWNYINIHFIMHIFIYLFFFLYSWTFCSVLAICLVCYLTLSSVWSGITFSSWFLHPFNLSPNFIFIFSTFLASSTKCFHHHLVLFVPDLQSIISPRSFPFSRKWHRESKV